VIALIFVQGIDLMYGVLKKNPDAEVKFCVSLTYFPDKAESAIFPVGVVAGVSFVSL
jgi:hypothetical protein